jgi:hypothetical protein
MITLTKLSLITATVKPSVALPAVKLWRFGLLRQIHFGFSFTFIGHLKVLDINGVFRLWSRPGYRDGEVSFTWVTASPQTVSVDHSFEPILL